MKAWELKTQLEKLLRDTGKGDRDIFCMNMDSELMDIKRVDFDEENNFFYVQGDWAEDE